MCDSRSCDRGRSILACKMCGDWTTRNHHPSSVFAGNIFSTLFLFRFQFKQNVIFKYIVMTCFRSTFLT